MTAGVNLYPFPKGEQLGQIRTIVFLRMDKDEKGAGQLHFPEDYLMGGVCVQFEYMKPCMKFEHLRIVVNPSGLLFRVKLNKINRYLILNRL